MAYETKVILTLIAEAVARSKTVKEAYGYIVRAANAEGLALPKFEEIKELIEQDE